MLTMFALRSDHTPSPRDPGATTSFSADYTWEFFSQFK
jgi:hypothetical protein